MQANKSSHLALELLFQRAESSADATALFKDAASQMAGDSPFSCVGTRRCSIRSRRAQEYSHASCCSFQEWAPGAQMVEREMHTLFPGDVQSVHVVYDTAKLDALVEEYEKIHGNLTDLLDDYTSKKRRHKKFKRKTVRPAPAVPADLPG